MKIILSKAIRRQFVGELRQAGRQEIGGCLLAECVGENAFKVLEITVQRHGGTTASFVRDPSFHRPTIDRFFEKHSREYQRFNYLGEWHSHPSFSTRPSYSDIQEMGVLLADPAAGASFAVLLIARLEWTGRLQAQAWVFSLGAPPSEAEVVSEGRFRFI